MIKQRNLTDCSICCLAMALDVTYEQVIDRARGYGDRGLEDAEETAIILGFGYGSRAFYKWWIQKNGGDFWRELRKKRAILSIPSLNFPGEYHSVYWDGRQLLDPSNLKTYTKDLVPAEARAKVILPRIGG